MSSVAEQPLATVSITTYNQKEYIAYAIEGALSQKTDFPYEILIGEDDSTDGTREICKKYAERYPHKIRLFLNERKNVIYINGRPTSRWNLMNLINNSKGKYFSLCEGDDYWTDPAKLKKQVDFLEKNPEYGMVHSDFDLLDVQRKKLIASINKKRNRIIPKNNYFKELLFRNYIATLTTCVRTDLIKKFLKEHKDKMKSWLMLDNPIWLYVSAHSKIGYFDESFGVRRRRRESASQSKDRQKIFDFLKSSYDIRFYFANRYGCSESIMLKLKNQYHEHILYHSFLIREKEETRNSYLFLRQNVDSRIKKIYISSLYFGSKIFPVWIPLRIFAFIKRSINFYITLHKKYFFY
jgi:glycosyltransferase involved in cell wall biosynthesis